MTLTSPPGRPAPPATAFAGLTCGRWLDWVVVALSALAVFATSVMMLRPVLGANSNLGTSLATGLTICTLVGIAYWRHPISQAVSWRLLWLADRPLWQIALFGLLLRAAWVLIFPAQPGSDGSLYLGLAQKLSAGHPYIVA